MSLSEIFSDAVKYPFSDITNFLFVGVLALMASISNVVASFDIDGTAVVMLASVISFIFALMLSGYCVSVVKKAISGGNDFPEIDLMNNLVDGIKAFIIALVYYIVPFIAVVVLAIITGAIGYSIDHLLAAMGILAIAAIILFLVFAVFEMIAMARFADTGNLGEAFNFGEVIADVKSIGFLKIIFFLIISFVILIVASIVSSILGFIPFIGVIIAYFVIGAFSVLFVNRALGLLYGSA